MIKSVDLDKTMQDSFLAYAEEVAINRAVPDVRDGLKLGLRQGLYAQYSNKLTHNHPYKKALKSVAAGTSQSYEHGEASLYDTLIRAAKPWVYRYPLEEAQGAYGSPCAPDDHSASRYVEMRSSQLADYLFDGLNKEAVDHWYYNYDDTELIPSVFAPIGFWPLVNGCSGIAVGFGTSISPTNLKEVNAALIKLIENPNATFEEVLCFPDYPSGATIVNKNEVIESLRNGTGKAVRMQATLNYDSKKNCIQATNIPYGVFTNTIISELAQLTDEDSNYGVEKVIDYTKKEGDIRIYLTKEADPNVMIKKLYRDTSLESFFGVNMTMLDHGKYPKVFGWREALCAYLDHAKECQRREYQFDLNKARAKEEVLEGLLIAIANIDDVVKIIRGSSSPKEAGEKLTERFGFTENQVKAILDLKLQRLINLEKIKIEKDLDSVRVDIKDLETILSDELIFNNKLIAKFKEVSDKFGDNRRTKVIQLEDGEENENTDGPQELKISIDMEGNIEKGNNLTKKEGNTFLNSSSVDTLVAFTSLGKMYKIPVNLISSKQKTNIYTLASFENNEKVMAVTCLVENPKYVGFFTKKGLFKKTAFEEYSKTKRGNGIIAIKLNDDDAIANIVFMDEEDVVVLTQGGMVIRFETRSISPIGRVTAGVKSIKLNDCDEVATGIIAEDKPYILITTTDGYGKKIEASEIPVQGRAGKGLSILKPTATTGLVNNILFVEKDQKISVFKDLKRVSFVNENTISLLTKNSICVQLFKSKISKIF